MSRDPDTGRAAGRDSTATDRQRPPAQSQDSRDAPHLDRALLDGFRRGDAATLANIYREEYAPLSAKFRRGFAGQGGGGRIPGLHELFDIEDCVHETFRRAFAERARRSYDGLRPFRPWLFQIGRNLRIDQLRRQGKRIEELAAEAPSLDAPAGHWASVDGAREQELVELRRELQRFVAELDERERAVFTTRFELQLSVRSAVEETGLTTMRVRTTERKLRKRLEKQLLESGYLGPLASSGVRLQATSVALWLLLQAPALLDRGPEVLP